jgi:predicted nucleic acid-binding protein
VPRLFALDSTIVIILGGGESAEPRAKEKAESILVEHEDAGEIVGIPAAAYAECCHCEVEGDFTIWPLNPPAAILANRLTAPMIEAARKNGCTKRAAKIDALILATAEITGCAGLYTTDGWFAEIAKREGLRVQIRSLPPVRPVQVPIPEAPQVHHDPAKHRGKKDS